MHDNANGSTGKSSQRKNPGAEIEGENIAGTMYHSNKKRWVDQLSSSSASSHLKGTHRNTSHPWLAMQSMCIHKCIGFKQATKTLPLTEIHKEEHKLESLVEDQEKEKLRRRAAISYLCKENSRC